MRIPARQLFLILYIILLIIPVSRAQQGKKIINAVRINAGPVVDGSGDDGVWKSIPGDSSFLQLDPEPGKSPAFCTTVKVAYTQDDIYFLFTCYDPEPDKIIAREMKYDGYTSGDDNVKLIIDTFGDERNAYWLATNPIGVKNDAVYTNCSDTEIDRARRSVQSRKLLSPFKLTGERKAANTTGRLVKTHKTANFLSAFT